MHLKKWKHTKKVISFMAALSMLSASMETAVVSAAVNTDILPVIEDSKEPEESGLTAPDSQLLEGQPDQNDGTVSQPPEEAPKLNDEAAGQPEGGAENQPPEEAPKPDDGTAGQPEGGAENQPPEEAPKPDDGSASQPEEGAPDPVDKTAGQTAGVPDPQEVYNRMIKLKKKYPEGMTWTNYEPYGTLGSQSEYRWQGGPILNNITSGVGCAAFAFILSDAAFGELKAREVAKPFTFENVNVGDILRINNNSHSVIVLQKSAAGVVIAEGNYNKTVHWGRVLSRQEVLNADFIVTRYPADYNSSETPENTKIVESGSEGSLNWTLTGAGTLTISGSGDMGNFSPDSLPSWNKCNNNVSTIVIGDGITRIGDYAFYQNPALSVYIASSVTGIGQCAFQKSGILSVTVPGSVNTIGNHAFRDCANLVSATISEGVKTIGENAFQACTTLQYIDFPASITGLGAAAFTDCKNMTRVRFKPGSETVTIGDNLFTHCWNLTEVILPEKADCISAGMFSGCNTLPKLYIPAGVTQIKGLGVPGGGPFAKCEALTEINFAGSEETWNSIGGVSAMTYSGSKAKVNFNVPFPDPFFEDENGHNHIWSSVDWSHDESYHWRECTTEGCSVTNNNEKGSYGEHSYGSWVVDVSATSSQSGSKHRECSVCSYRQTSSIPATGSSSSGSSGGSWGWGSSGSISQPVTSVSPDTSDNTNKDSDSENDNPANTDQNTGGTGSNPANDSSSGLNDSENTDQDSNADNADASNSSAGNQKQLKTKFKKQLKTDLKQQIRVQLKTKLKTELKLKSKAKLKKQLKAELKQQVKKKLKKQLKKQYREELGDDFTELFNLQFNAQFNKVYNEQFNVQYKKLSSRK